MKIALPVSATLLLAGSAFAQDKPDVPLVSPALTSLVSSDDIQIKLEGRVQTDFVFATGDAPYDTADGVNFRRAYFGIGGTIYDWIDIKAVYDMANGGVLTDVYARANDVGIRSSERNFVSGDPKRSSPASIQRSSCESDVNSPSSLPRLLPSR